MVNTAMLYLLVTILLFNNCLLLEIRPPSLPRPPLLEQQEVEIVTHIDNDKSVYTGPIITNIVVEKEGSGGRETGVETSEEGNKREKRACPEECDTELVDGSTTVPANTTVLPYDGPTGPSLGVILGVVTVFCTIFYVIGITYKLVKIWRGEYEAQEPVYLKYK